MSAYAIPAVLIALLMSMCSQVSAQRSESTEVAAKVQALLEQLADPDAAVRREARSKLVALGPEAEPALNEFAAATSIPEARLGAQAALAQIAQNDVTRASSITLHLKAASPGEAFEELARQAHGELIPAPPNLFRLGWRPPTAISINIDHQPFWSAMKELCRQAKVWPAPNRAGPGLLLVMGQDPFAEPAVMSGPAMIVFDGGAAARAPGTVVLRFTVHVEPRVRILGRASGPVLEQIVDEQGRVLAPAVRPSDWDRMGHENMWDFRVRLSRPPDGARKIPRLRGRYDLIVPDKIERVEIPDPLSAKDILTPTAGGSVIVREAKRTRGGYRIKLEDVQSEPSASPLLCDLFPPHLVDDHGQIRSCNSMNGSGWVDKRRTVWDLAFDTGPDFDPAALVLDVPAGQKTLSLPFEFQDLPLP